MQHCEARRFFAALSGVLQVMGKQAEFDEFINHHVMNHSGSPEAWNLPFLHLDFLEWLHYDSVVLFIVSGVLIVLGLWARAALCPGGVPRGIAAVMERYAVFMRDEIVYANFGPEKGKAFVPFFCTTFLFLLTANLLGLVPLFTAVTGNLGVTAAFALIFFGMSLFGVARFGGFHGFKAAFLPSGLPVALRPVMVVIEALSFCTRTFALAMRLFANMMGGHIVLYSLLGLSLVMGWQASPSFLLGIAIYLFEVFVAVFQAYIFTLLSAIFMGMMVNPQH